MRFNKSALALCISGALLTGNVIADTSAQVESRTSFKQNQSKAIEYTVHLSHAPALTKYVKGKHNYKNEAAQVASQQESILNHVMSLDSEVRVVGKSKLLGNFITISSAHITKEQLQQISGVTAVNEVVRTTSLAQNNKSYTLSNQQRSEAVSEEIVMMEPLTGSDTAGEGATVAIVSTGIDYTHSFFGGNGEYGDDGDPETPPLAGSYMEAFENGAVGPTIPAVEDDPTTPDVDESADAIPGYDGFPTDVVIGGKDFNSENYGEDANPIDQNLVGSHWSGWEYPTGMGTELASIVHQLAPGAKLFAYKVTNISPYSWNPSQFDVRTARSEHIMMAIEHALDPNEDGDTSDHVDVVLLDAGSGAAFFDQNASGGAGGSSLVQTIIQRAAALGTTIVTHAGAGGVQDLNGNIVEDRFRSWTSTEGAATNAITVGSAILADDDSLSAADWSPMGPVRGSKALKPEIMAIANDIPVMRISQADEAADTKDMRTDAVSAAAKIAAAAAVIKGANPALGPVEIKALLANTATEKNIAEYDDMDSEMAELLLIGHGLTDVEAAVSSPVVIWEKTSYQPYIQFGFHEVGTHKRVTKHITLRNLSDSAQTYNMSYMMNGEKAAHDALEINYPASVNIPANSSVEVAIEVNIDGTMLPEWPLQSTEDFTPENLKSTELNGYFTLTSDGNPEINVGWMIQARNETTIDKMAIGEEYPYSLGWNSDLGRSEWVGVDWAETFYPDSEWGAKTYKAKTSSFVNESQSATTFEAYPLFQFNAHEPLGKENVSGHKIRAVGGGLYDEAMCSSGKKLSIAVNFFQPANVALANYMDKIGAPLFFYDLFHEQIVLDNGANNAFNGIEIWDESQVVNQPFVQLNSKGQPATFYINYNKEYDWTNPSGRYTESKLPVRFSNDGTNVVSEVCVDELYHHELDSIEDFDQNMGFHLETDRDAIRDKGEPIVQFNPVKGGYYAEEEVCQSGWLGSWCEVMTVDKSVRIGLGHVSDEESIETAELSHIYRASPGEKVSIAAAKPDFYNGPKGEFMVISTADNFFERGFVDFDDEDGSVHADVRGGQKFSIDEDAQMGTVVGQIKLDTAGFFAVGDAQSQQHELHIVNALPGSPFAIDQATLELVVANPDALDYENQSEYEVQIVAQQGNGLGTPQMVMVYINDVNDIAPEVMADVAAAVPAVNVKLSGDNATAFSIDFTGVFVESEGQALTYTASAPGLSNVSINGTTVSGNVTESGNYVVTVVASDGVHETTADFSVSAEMADTTSSGGSMGGMLAILAGLVAFRRRK
ncbi:S8 family serine peptidase [Thalassotalea eurytherma]|uniref:Cadherin domain-containing protein n=1 Tax=Thalassotalea eurytherma TaxID=1144278 RepID=A0ABQ6H2D3_9GAMM|nr:S8 family serine peptidase [Thalassotalea eurytherma]GLX81679.1 hypothetical protein theurythT_11310 [Thalassotalea eurytherma]